MDDFKSIPGYPFYVINKDGIIKNLLLIDGARARAAAANVRATG